MKFLILALIVGLAAADVSHILPPSEQAAEIVEQVQNINPDGAYEWKYQTSNGIAAAAAGTLKTIDKDTVALTAEGQASWKTPEGDEVNLQYIADENGYQPQGSHIPTPPPIPDYILRALQFIRDNPPQVAAEAKLIK